MNKDYSRQNRMARRGRNNAVLWMGLVFSVVMFALGVHYVLF